MEIKLIFINLAYVKYQFIKHVGVILALLLLFGLVGLTSCGRKSQAIEDEESLKLVGYDLNQAGFFKAVTNDDIPALKIFKERKFDLNQQDLIGKTAMHVAAESGSVAALSFLSKHGADIEPTDSDGVTPLMAAARAGKMENSEAIRFLLKKGANARSRDKAGKFPLIHAMDGGSAEAIHLLAAQSRKLLDTGILYAANMGHDETIPVLVKYGASVYARNSGKTSLMIAAERGHDKSVQALIDEGANLYAVSDDGKLAKDYAEGNERVLAALLGSDADTKEDTVDLEWSEEELESLVQKAMDRSQLVEEIASAETEGEVSIPKPEITGKSKRLAKVNRLKGKNLAIDLTDSAVAQDQVIMAAYTERTLPIKVKATDDGKVEAYDLRKNKAINETNKMVIEGSEIGVTGLRVKKIKKKVVNNKLTGGRDKELVTLVVEDMKTGQLREVYAGYDSQVADAVAVLEFKATGEYLIVERYDEFSDLKGTTFKVMDVNDEEVIIENIGSGQLIMLPLMGIKK